MVTDEEMCTPKDFKNALTFFFAFDVNFTHHINFTRRTAKYNSKNMQTVLVRNLTKEQRGIILAKKKYRSTKNANKVCTCHFAHFLLQCVRMSMLYFNKV